MIALVDFSPGRTAIPFRPLRRVCLSAHKRSCGSDCTEASLRLPGCDKVRLFVFCCRAAGRSEKCFSAQNHREIRLGGVKPVLRGSSFGFTI